MRQSKYASPYFHTSLVKCYCIFYVPSGLAPHPYVNFRSYGAIPFLPAFNFIISLPPHISLAIGIFQFSHSAQHLIVLQCCAHETPSNPCGSLTIHKSLACAKTSTSLLTYRFRISIRRSYIVFTCKKCYRRYHLLDKNHCLEMSDLCVVVHSIAQPVCNALHVCTEPFFQGSGTYIRRLSYHSGLFIYLPSRDERTPHGRLTATSLLRHEGFQKTSYSVITDSE